jgi:1-aminocyclopropane-1-carboxylate deaminase/D-cysteine desulfhydrase-like pyridoxal-dependent ACC family enzyme
VALATLPTPLERGPLLPGGAQLWVKRDDLTGLGMGGNKARKLELLCGAALAGDADTLVTVGAAQSNHCRMTAAAGARLGLPVHLVLGGERPAAATGNQLLSELFGAQLHHAGTSSWAELEAAQDSLCEELCAAGHRPFAMPIGGSTPTGAVGFAIAYDELVDQAAALGCAPVAIVHATSSGGTHAGLLAGKARHGTDPAAARRPGILAIGVAKDVVVAPEHTAALANGALELLGRPDVEVAVDEVVVDPGFLGQGYAVPTAAADAALRWAATRGGWVLDRVYTAKAFAGLLAMAEAGQWRAGDDVVFWHTGGQPAVFAPGGAPEPLSRGAPGR